MPEHKTKTKRLVEVDVEAGVEVPVEVKIEVNVEVDGSTHVS